VWPSSSSGAYRFNGDLCELNAPVCEGVPPVRVSSSGCPNTAHSQSSTNPPSSPRKLQLPSLPPTSPSDQPARGVGRVRATTHGTATHPGEDGTAVEGRQRGPRRSPPLALAPAEMRGPRLAIRCASTPKSTAPPTTAQLLLLLSSACVRGLAKRACSRAGVANCMHCGSPDWVASSRAPASLAPRGTCT
jgi:hypothetical protein